MLLRPISLPDELDRGYLGRVMRLNGKSNQKEILSLIARWVESSNKAGEKLPIVELLSMVAGTNLQDFVCQHTTLPLWRSITASLYNFPHGDGKTRDLLRNYGMRNIRLGAYFCKKCMEEELANYGTSYWHRKLQIPGLFWCPNHLTPLNYVDSEGAFLTVPHMLSDASQSINEKWVGKFQESREVQKFIDISYALLERSMPLSLKNVANLFRNKANSRDLINAIGSRQKPLFSDLVIDCFDPEWLALTFPVIEHKIRGKRMYQLDGLFTGKKVSVTAFIVSAVVLFDTADEALSSIVVSPDELGLKQLKKNSCYGAQMDEDDLRASYVRCGGDHKLVAKELQKLKLSVSGRLNILGLPDLSLRGGATQSFIEAFFVKGLSLSESSEISGISEFGMEHTLRTLGGAINNVMKDLKKVKSGKGAINRKARARVPHEVNRESIVF